VELWLFAATLLFFGCFLVIIIIVIAIPISSSRDEGHKKSNKREIIDI